MSISIHDKATVLDRQILPNGFMRIKARFARTGIQVYKGREIGLDGDRSDGDIRVYRPPEEVFKSETLDSFSGVPIIRSHAAMITTDNWREHTRGFVNGVPAKDEDHVVATLLFTDKETIDSLQRGPSELSAGYYCDFDHKPGTTPGGEAYDSIQKNIVGNHIALVPNGRCGPTCKVGDCAGGASCSCGQGEDMTTKKITVDGVTIDVTEQGEQVITKLQGQLSTLNGQFDALKQSAADEKKTLEEKLAEAEKKIPDAAAIDALINDKLLVVAQARLIVGDSFEHVGKSSMDIKKEVVKTKMGDKAVTGRDDAYILAAFDLLADAAKQTAGNKGNKGGSTGDSVRDALRTGGAQPGNKNKQTTEDTDPNDSKAAYDAMVNDLAKAYLGKEGRA